MIELALQKGNMALAHKMIERTAPVGHLDANMLTIRNQYLQHYFERAGDYRRAYEYLKRDCRLMILSVANGYRHVSQNWICAIVRTLLYCGKKCRFNGRQVK